MDRDSAEGLEEPVPLILKDANSLTPVKADWGGRRPRVPTPSPFPSAGASVLP